MEQDAVEEFTFDYDLSLCCCWSSKGTRKSVLGCGGCWRSGRHRRRMRRRRRSPGQPDISEVGKGRKFPGAHGQSR